MILECFEHRNLPEGGGRYTFLIAFEFDLLDGYNFAVGIDPFEDPAECPLANLFKISVFLKFFHLNYFYNTPNSMIRTRYLDKSRRRSVKCPYEGEKSGEGGVEYI